MAAPVHPLRRLHEHLPDPPHARVLLGIFATGWTVTAVAFWEVRQFEAFFPLLWPIWYAGTAATCWAFLLRPWSRRLLVLSGGMSFVAVLSRTGGVLVNLLDSDHYRKTSVWYGVLGLVFYPLFAVALLYVWDVGFSDLWDEYRGRRREQGRPGGRGEHPGG